MATKRETGIGSIQFVTISHCPALELRRGVGSFAEMLATVLPDFPSALRLPQIGKTNSRADVVLGRLDDAGNVFTGAGKNEDTKSLPLMSPAESHGTLKNNCLGCGSLPMVNTGF